MRVINETSKRRRSSRNENEKKNEILTRLIMQHHRADLYTAFEPQLRNRASDGTQKRKKEIDALTFVIVGIR